RIGKYADGKFQMRRPCPVHRDHADKQAVNHAARLREANGIANDFASRVLAFLSARILKRGIWHRHTWQGPGAQRSRPEALHAFPGMRSAGPNSMVSAGEQS